jgi:hypothetical protein
MTSIELLIIVIAVCALVAVHALVSATERPGLPPRSYGETLHELATGTDTIARALCGGVLGALAFAGLAPALPTIGSLLGTVIPG